MIFEQTQRHLKEEDLYLKIPSFNFGEKKHLQGYITSNMGKNGVFCTFRLGYLENQS